mmetsp:Transcript_8152/g.34260  ORF Transcript_8152/g.34260 Transcript_8152/m.34260 type:complete len:788 (+) Transcript_8152:144-2507(+)
MAAKMSVHDKRNLELDTYLRKEEAVRQWLEEVMGASFPHEYLALLKDGTILCSVMRFYAEDSVPHFNAGPDLPFFAMKNNLAFFLAACREQFGFAKAQLFDVYDLVHLRAPVKVLSLVYKVVARISASPNWEGPRLRKVTAEALEEHRAQKENLKQIAAQLREIDALEAMRSPRGCAPLSARRPCPVRPRLKFDVKQLSMAERRKVMPLVTRFQAHIRGFLARKTMDKLRRREAYRTKIAHEMLETERKYQASLNVLMEEFLTPMKAREDLQLDVQQVRQNVSIIVTFSKELLQALEPRVAEWSPSQRIGDIFVSTAHFFKVYTNYVQAYTTVVGQLTKLREADGKLNDILGELENSPAVLSRANNTYLPFESYLILPIQRLPRYEMLLKDMYKHTDAGQADHGSLEEALRLLGVVCKQINECQREFEAFNKMMEVKAMFGDQLEDNTGIQKFVRFTRKFLLESIMWVGSRKGKKKHLFLFNDLLITGFPKDRRRQKYTLDAVYRVRFTSLEAFEGKSEEEFGVRLLDGSEPLLDLVTHSEAEQQKWIKTYAAAKEELQATRPSDDEVSRDRRPSVWVAALESADGQWKKPDVPVEILMAMGKMGAIPSPPTRAESPASPASTPSPSPSPGPTAAPSPSRAEKGRRHKARKSISKLADLGIMKKPRSATPVKSAPAAKAKDSPKTAKASPALAATKRSGDGTPAKKRLSIMKGFGRKSKAPSPAGHRRSNSEAEEAAAAMSLALKPERQTRGHRRSVSSDHRPAAEPAEEITELLGEIDELLDLADI